MGQSYRLQDEKCLFFGYVCSLRGQDAETGMTHCRLLQCVNDFAVKL